MTQESLHPGLGSGALREGEIVWVPATVIRVFDQQLNVGIHRIAPNQHSYYAVLDKNEIVQKIPQTSDAALSLSSPIEPAPTITPQMMSGVFAKSVNNTDPEHDHVYDHRIAAAEINRLLGAQASSEVRAKMMASFDKVIPSFEMRVQIVSCILGALAPSRQGAAKRVEG